MKSTKAEISTIFKYLEDYGYLVKSFGDKRPGRKATKGWVDIIVLNKRRFICIEVKTDDTKDKLRTNQKIMAEYLSSISTFTNNFHYYQIRNIKEAINLRSQILTGKL